MSVFLRQFQHLLPRSKTWALAVDRTLRKFFLGLANANEDHREFIDAVYSDLWPDTTRELAQWENQHGLSGSQLSDEERVAALSDAWAAQGGQSLEYIQSRLQGSGFNVYLHPFWVADRNPGELAGAYYSERTLDVSSADTASEGLFFGKNGEKLYTVGTTADIVAEWDLSTPYRVDTATASGNTLDVTSEAAVPVAGHISEDGTTVFLLNQSDDTVYQYDLSTAWDISSASYSGNSLSVTSEQTLPFGMAVKPDGTAFYISGNGSASIFEYTLTTAWDLSTASYSGNSFNPGAGSGKRGVTFTGDGKKLLFCTTSTIYQCTLTTAWDITTASYDSITFDPDETTTDIRDIYLGGNGGLGVGYNNGVTLFLITSSDDVYQYSLADYEPRDPNDYLTNPLLGVTQCGEDLAECGEADAVCGTTTVNDPDYIVNLDLTVRAPPQLPTDAQYFPYFFYVGGETFGNNANVPARRRAGFERLLLKHRPNNQWIGLFIDYVDELETEGGDLLTTESGDILSLE